MERVSSVKLSSFGTGRYPINTMACDFTFRRILLAMFPIVSTGQALLSPRKLESCVLSEERMIGATVEPMGNFP